MIKDLDGKNSLLKKFMDFISIVLILTVMVSAWFVYQLPPNEPVAHNGVRPYPVCAVIGLTVMAPAAVGIMWLLLRYTDKLAEKAPWLFGKKARRVIRIIFLSLLSYVLYRRF